MRTAIQEYIEKHDKKIEEDPDYAVDYFQSLIIDVSSDIDEIKKCVDRMRKNKDILPYIQHRLDMISVELNETENHMNRVLEIIKKAEEDNNKIKDQGEQQ